MGNKITASFESRNNSSQIGNYLCYLITPQITSVRSVSFLRCSNSSFAKFRIISFGC